jgi:hypothetical protein
MSVKVTVPNTSSDSVVFGSANTPTAAEVVGIDSGSSNGQLAFKTTAGGTSTERMRIDANGNVGIGTSSPARQAVIYGSFPCLQLANSTSGVTSNDGLLIYENGLNATLSNQESGYMSFETANTERMRIDSSGNVMMGTTTAAGSGLTVGTGLLWCVGSYNNTTASAANMNIGSNGGISRSTSALKYKKNVRDLPSIDISKFRPIVYNSKCDGDDQTVDYFGFIADEVDDVGIKELVSYGADGQVEGFQYERMTAVLTKVIQELKAELDTVKAELIALKGA